MDTLLNAVGCDSFLTLNLTINNATSSFESASACGNYNWNGTNLTASGIYLDTLQNAVGCDSFLTLNLTVDLATTSMIQPTTCDSYTSPSGQYTWTSSGSYQDTIQNQAGCDSIISIQLVVTQIDTSVSEVQGTLTANQTGGTYQWIDCSTGMAIAGETNISFSPSASGTYAVAIQFSGCQDTSGCRQVTIVGREPIRSLTSFQVFPNPNRGRFHIQVNGLLERGAAKIFDLQGKLIHEQQLQEGNNLVQMPHVAKGVYLLRVTESGIRFHKRILIQ